jgi:tungstate transport system substrate-binding protein
MKTRIALIFALLLLVMQLTAVSAQTEVVCEQEITVQADDWLSKIAEKVYGDVLAYPALAEATNAMHATDASFAMIDNVDVIEPGWKLCAPSAAAAAAMLNTAVAAPAMDAAPADNMAEPATAQAVGRLILATTTSTQDAGLLDVILPDFNQKYGAETEVIAVGTGQAMTLGENGDADVLLVHARSREDAFVEAGFGVNRQEVMYNDFVLLGPPSDPAGIKGMTDVAAALEKIAAAGSTFISRGDDSGTHTKELGLWKTTTVPLVDTPSLSDPAKTFARPGGEWYQAVGQGMGATLTMANEQQAYTLSDRATYLARTLEGTDLQIVVEGDSRLFNPYGVIAVNPEKHPGINFAGAQAFIEWITSVETQQLISQFGVDQFGSPLFVSDSAAWNAAK